MTQAIVSEVRDTTRTVGGAHAIIGVVVVEASPLGGRDIPIGIVDDGLRARGAVVIDINPVQLALSQIPI